MLRSLFLAPKSVRRPGTDRRSAPFKPGVEALDGRVMPAAISAYMAGTSLVVQGSADADTISVHLDAANRLQVSQSGVRIGTFNASRVSDLLVRGAAGADTISLSQAGANFWSQLGIQVAVRGGGGNDSITGGSGVDDLAGGGGRDNIHGGGGDDTCDGGAGNDVLRGGNGFDYLVGGAGNDRLLGGAGDDSFVLGLGDDNVDGGIGIDRYFTQLFNDAAPTYLTNDSGFGAYTDSYWDTVNWDQYYDPYGNGGWESGSAGYYPDMSYWDGGVNFSGASTPAGSGYDPYGMGSYGYDPYGLGSSGYDPYGMGSYGYDPYGMGSYGYDPYGMGSYGYDPYGLGSYGYDPYGLGSYGNDPYASIWWGTDPFGSTGFADYNPLGYDPYGGYSDYWTQFNVSDPFTPGFFENLFPTDTNDYYRPVRTISDAFIMSTADSAASISEYGDGYRIRVFPGLYGEGDSQDWYGSGSSGSDSNGNAPTYSIVMDDNAPKGGYPSL